MSIEAMKLAIEALELAKNSHGMMLLSDPPQEAWKTYRVDDAIKKSTTALRQAIEQAQSEANERSEVEPVKVPHKHEWFRTGEMKIGQMRCISCGIWGQEESPPQRQPNAEDFEDYCKTLHPFWNTRMSRTEAEGFFHAGWLAAHGIKGKV